MFATTFQPLHSAVLPAEGNRAFIKNVLLIVAGSLLLWASAKLNVRTEPVPMTMQTLVLLLISMAYGWRLAAATVALYLTQGLVGMPVFAGIEAGPAYMLGRTGGYLAGFFAAAVVVGWLAERGFDRNILTTVLAMVIGNAIIYLIGAGYLSTFIGFGNAIKFGVYPFLGLDLVKIIIAAIALPGIWAILKR